MLLNGKWNLTGSLRVKNLCTKYCCKSLNKQSSGVQERINPFYINSYGENSFGLRTFRFTNDLQERIKFVNRGLSVLCIGPRNGLDIFAPLTAIRTLDHPVRSLVAIPGSTKTSTFIQAAKYTDIKARHLGLQEVEDPRISRQSAH